MDNTLTLPLPNGTLRDNLFRLGQFLYDYESWAEQYPNRIVRLFATRSMLNFKHDMELRGMCFEPPFAEDGLCYLI